MREGEIMRRGVAMIELIFALVIIGIVLMSAPTLIQQTIKSGYVALQQESIAAAAAHTNILLSKHWDEGDANNTAGVAPVISVTPTYTTPFDFSGVQGNVATRTQMIGATLLPPSPIGLDLNESANDISTLDDIDDFDNIPPIKLALFNAEATTAGEGDYVDQNISIATRVWFADDRPNGTAGFAGSIVDAGNTIFTAPAPAQSNIKRIVVNLTSDNDIPELNKSITLHAFSCNLGTYVVHGRQF